MVGRREAAPRVSSALAAVELRQVPPPLIIGERVNTQGSARAKRMVMADDYDGLVDLAREQVDDGAHCLDVCVATTERDDEKDFMVSLVKRLSIEIAAPLVIDSTDPDVVEAAVRQAPGRPMINSINLEGDGSKFARLAPVMARYGVPAVAMCIGPDGMAKTPEEKLRTAEMMVEEGKKYGLREDQFVFDVITFTLGTGQDEFAGAAVRTLEGIELVKRRFPSAFTTLGLSNISFGLKPAARRAINSAFLHHAVARGLDSAIVNARDITPYAQLDGRERELADGLIFNRGPDALPELIEYFEALGSGGAGGRRRGDEVDPSWPPGRRAHYRIVHRLKDGVRDDVVEAIAEKIGRTKSLRRLEGGGGGGGGDSAGPGAARTALDEPPEATHDGAIRTLNEDLLPAMKEVGDLFGDGKLILPFVLKSAECMKAAVAELEKYLLRGEEGAAKKGTLVLGTVYGDVHDIGKNLVKTIFENNGYAVHDLGKQVPLQAFLDKIDEVHPDAVGLSALLVVTSTQMGQFVEHARRTGMDLPVLCGGAAINTDFVNRIATKGGVYGPGVFYCATMFDGLRTMEELVADGGARRGGLLEEWRGGLERWRIASEAREARRAAAAAAAASQDGDRKAGEGAGPRSSVRPVAAPPKPPSLGVRARLGPGDIDMDQVWHLVDKRSLFKMSWGLRGRAGQESEADHERLLGEWKARVASERLFEPAAVYGYFRCAGGDGDTLRVERPGGGGGGDGGGAVEFDFPRSSREKRLCLADYFGPADTVAFQAVTVGARASAVIDGWNAQDRYSDAYYLHGLAVETAEALAEWTHRRIRSDLGLEPGRGLRYSWGYPSCPDVGQHRLVWDLLDPGASGMSLTDAGQIVPEQSTAAVIVHHPDAEYFGL